jgi:glycosyltransferase involved in cell wall biosynthesis
MASMRVAIDAELIGRDGSGNETYLTGIVRSLQRVASPGDDFVLVGRAADALQDLAGPRATVVTNGSGPLADLRLGRVMAGLGADVAIATYNAPLFFRGTRATVVHDVSFRRVPETFPSLLRRRIALSVRRSIAVSDLVVTVSEFCKREISELYPRLDPARIVVASNAADDAYAAARSDEEIEAVARRYALPDRFVLAVGNVQPRKNLSRLLDAAGRVGVAVVVAGQPGWMSNRGLAADVATRAQWLGRVSTDDLACLYRLCAAMAYPSLYEGFGLPVVEAMAAGAVVVTSHDTALAEVAGDGAILVDPRSVDAIAQGLAEALGSGARTLWAPKARASAARFSWDQSAGQLYQAMVKSV